VKTPVYSHSRSAFRGNSGIILSLTALLSIFLIVSSAPPAFAQLKLSGTAPTAIVRVAPIKYRQRTLANGLQFFSIESHKSPTVAIQVWYNVGGKNDPEGRSGFAHLFEHMMFKSTKNQKNENLDRLTEDVGGANNAFTQEDHTVYHETVPSNYLQTLLWAESDRMANLNVTESNFISERAVVQEEFRQGVLADPYGRLSLAKERNSFTVHPYRRGVIGSIADLDAATISDVRDFHSTFYRPDNATLIVSGDFDPAQLDAWVDKYFGRIAKPITEIPRITVEEPVRTAEKRVLATAPNVPLPAIAINFLLPPRRDPDSVALRVAEVILSRGDSSRINQSLVYRQRVAAQASAYLDFREDASLLDMTIITAGDKSPEAADKAALAELEKLKTTPVSAAELAKAQNILLADALEERETAEGQAFALGEAAVRLGDPDRVNSDIARLQAVTAADIQRVAQKYLTTKNRLVIRYINGKDQESGTGKAAKASPAKATVFTPQETAPFPAAPRPVAFPLPEEKKLANGIRVIVVPRPGTGMVSITASVRAGSVLESNREAGLADFTGSLLTRGTKKRSAPQIAETVEALGGSLSSGASWDTASVRLSSLASRIEGTLPVFAEVVRAPAFATDEINRLRSENIDNLSVDLRNPGTIANRTAARIVYGESAYGHSLRGTPETLKNLNTTTIHAFYESHYQPRQTILVFGGDITPAAAFALAARYFGDWKPAGRSAPLAPAPAIAQKGGRVVVIDKADAGQAAVTITRPAIRRSDPAYPVGRVTNSVLGDGFSSRLNQEIRIKRGLSYGASSNLDTRRDGGIFIASAQTRNDAAPEVASLLKTELNRMATDPVPGSELIPRKASLSGDFARGLETGAGLTSFVASLASYDLPLSLLNSYLKQLESVTPAQIQQFARKYLSATDASIVIVGDARQFLPALKKRFPNVEVILERKLNLNSASLVKQK
jgi:zinc protease